MAAQVERPAATREWSVELPEWGLQDAGDIAIVVRRGRIEGGYHVWGERGTVPRILQPGMFHK